MRLSLAKYSCAVLLICACGSQLLEPPLNVTVSLPTSSIAVGEATQATARQLDGAGKQMDGSPTWTTSNDNAAVSASGLVQGVNAGTVSVIATATNGVSGSTQLTITNVQPPPQPPQPPQPPSAGLLATHDFDDGTLGPYLYESVAGDMDIIADPTGSGRGKVVRFHYAGVAQDRNRAIVYAVDTHLGDSLFFKGDFYIPSNASTDGSHIQRKLLYWQSARWPNTPQFWSVIAMFGAGANNQNTYVKADGSGADYTNNPVTRPGSYTFGVWHTLETQVYLGSAPGKADGVFRQWLDGVLVENQLNKKWTDAAWPVPASDIKFDRYYVGDQVNGQDAAPFDEYRYWDNISFSRTRIR